MKIGILTLSLHTNYGGILQAYALQTVLERMGHKVCLIEKRRPPLRLPLWKAPLSYGKRILKNLTGHPFPIFYEQKMNRETPIVRQNTDKFINKYIKQKMVDDFLEIKETDFDAIVVGSDQVWRPKYFKDKIENAFLDFAKSWNIKRIAYAASFGTDEWEYAPKQTKRCGELLKLFDFVSVREMSGINLCATHFDLGAKLEPDPTMLLTTEDYMRLFEVARTPKSSGTLLYYILNETTEQKKWIKKIAEEKGLKPFNVKAKSNITDPLPDRIQPPVEQWLRGFYDAEFVVTDSFHACVFSILFSKNFIVFPNKIRGITRIQSLLSSFHLDNRIVSTNNIYEEQDTINWHEINAKLRRRREEFSTIINLII